MHPPRTGGEANILEAPRRRGRQVVAQCLISATTKRRLRVISGQLDQSCPELFRRAIGELIAKYESGGQRTPIEMPHGARFNQQGQIDEAVKKKVHQLAARHDESMGNLLREAIDDFLVRYDAEHKETAP